MSAHHNSAASVAEELRRGLLESEPARRQHSPSGAAYWVAAPPSDRPPRQPNKTRLDSHLEPFAAQPLSEAAHAPLQQGRRLAHSPLAPSQPSSSRGRGRRPLGRTDLELQAVVPDQEWGHRAECRRSIRTQSASAQCRNPALRGALATAMMCPRAKMMCPRATTLHLVKGRLVRNPLRPLAVSST